MKRREALPFAGLLLASAVLASGCGSSAETSVNVAGPSATRCQPALQPQPSSFGPTGGTGSVAVTVSRECTWSASANAPWIVLMSGREGQGDGSIAYRIPENPDPVSRRGTISVQDQTVQLAQEAAPCRFTVSAGETTVPFGGGDVRVDVRTHTACSWTASSTVPWASPAPASGSGNGTVVVRVTANAGAAGRTADVIVAGQPITLSQGAQAAPPPPSPNPPSPPAPTPPPTPTPTPPPTPTPTPPPSPTPPPPSPPPTTCEYEISPDSAAFESEGGTGSVRLRTGPACPWTALSTAGWVRVTTALVGIGDTEIRYVVEANFARSKREATIVIAGREHKISQEGGEDIRLEGRISGLTGSCPNLRFSLDGQTVVTSGETDFKDGRCSDARNGAEAKVTGRRRSDGTILARRVEFDD